MKSFQQFIESYADLRARVRAKQMSELDASKSRTQAEVQNRKNAEEKKKQVDTIRTQVKREYGIKD
jgi:hypothetical protein